MLFRSVFAAVLGHPYGPSEERGIYRSTDGGQTWQKVISKDENTGGSDVEIDPANPDKNHSGLSYSQSLEAAVQLLLADPAIQDDPGTSSFKFIWAARFLKDNAPHVFHVREMRAGTRNSMDRWLWDLLG